MSLKAQITQDMKDAMRAKDSLRLGTIRLLQAAIKQREVDERIELDDTAVVSVIDKLIKQRKDSIAAYEQANRPELAAQEQAEMDILKAYQPERMSQEAIDAAVQAIGAAFEAQQGRKPAASDMGALMGMAKKELSGKADMGQVSGAVKALLQP